MKRVVNPTYGLPPGNRHGIWVFVSNYNGDVIRLHAGFSPKIRKLGLSPTYGLPPGNRHGIWIFVSNYKGDDLRLHAGFSPKIWKLGLEIHRILNSCLLLKVDITDILSIDSS